jgi:glycine/D-amino acid oxidase-like deaminating enzyme
VIAEVAVVGAGIVGAAVARELAMRGVSVALLDRAGVSQGTTGLGEGNVLCCDKLPGPELELTLHGLAVYDEIDERLGDVARIRRKGALLVHTDAATWAAEPARLARMAGVEAERLAPEQVRAAEPELDGPIHGASHFPRDLQCDPAAIARALAGEAAAAGAQVRTGCAVERIVVSGGRVGGLHTADGPIACGAVVVAAGTWSAALAATAGLRLPVAPRKGQLVLVRAPRPGFVRHKVVEASYLAAVGSAGADLQVSTVIETTWSGDVLVGSSRERRGFDVEPDPAVSDALVERAARLFGAVRGLERAGAWAGLRPWLPDHLPAIGASRAVPGLWVASGHEGAGVALGPVTGRVLAQAYCGEPALVDLTPFDPDRFA